MKALTRNISIDNITVLAIIVVQVAIFVYLSSGLSFWNKIYLVLIFSTVLLSSFASLAVAIQGIGIDKTIIRVCIFSRGIGMFLFTVGAMYPVLIADHSTLTMLVYTIVGSIIWLGSLFAEERLSP